MALSQQTWSKHDLQMIKRSHLRENDLEAWSRQSRRPEWLARHKPGLEMEVVDVHKQYVPVWKSGTYVPDFVKAEGTDSVPCIHVYGRSEDGESVCARVWNYHPYFHVAASKRLKPKRAERVAKELAEYIDQRIDPLRKRPRRVWLAEHGDDDEQAEVAGFDFSALGGSGGGNAWTPQQSTRRRGQTYKDPGPCVVSVEPVSRIDATDCRARRRTFFRITMRTPNYIAPTRDLFQDANNGKGLVVRQGGIRFAFHPKTYESNVLFESRFMIDRDIVGGGWAAIAAGDYEVTEKRNKTTRCDIEIDLDYQAIQGFSMHKEGEVDRFNRKSRMRAVCYDLECAGQPGKFPSATVDPIIQIGVTAWDIGEDESMHGKETKIIFVLGSCHPIRGVRVVSYATERELLNAFGLFLQTYDPDIITGYNTRGFDNPYLFDRAQLHNATELLHSGRHLNRPIQKRENEQKSRNYGNRKDFEVYFEGRVEYDIMGFLQKNKKLSSYTLNSVSAKYLGDQKEDLHYSLITPLQKGNSKDRQRIAIYCVKDTLLPKQIADKLQPFPQMIEFARATGVQMRDIEGKGSSMKVMTAVLRAIKGKDMVMPYMPNQEKRDYEGANVFTPMPNFYTTPVAVLDFSALYPSIMIAHNICFSTYVPPDWRHFFDPEELEACPNGHTYLRRDVRKGVLTEILEDLLRRRNEAKALAKAAKDAGDMVAFMVYECRQLAIKVLANSVYGWTGLNTSVYFWFCADSVTSYGREQIKLTQRVTEREFTKAKGYPFDAQVVYGDTDSVMVHIDLPIEGNKLDPPEKPGGRPVPSAATKAVIAKVIEYAHVIAARCTEEFAAPNKLEFENVYWPYLLLKEKKRYAGPFWENAEKPSYTKIRGLQSVRRDNCEAARSAQEKCLDAILYELDPEKAMQIAKDTIRRLRSGEMDLGDLVITQRLNSRQNDMTLQEKRRWCSLDADNTAYKAECERRGVYTTMQPHAELDRILQGRTGMGYNLNERVPYIIADKALHKTQDKVFRKAEDPIYFLEHDMLPDLEYYTEQIIKCTANVLAPVYENRLRKGIQSTIDFGTPSKRSREEDSEATPAPKKMRTGPSSASTAKPVAPRATQQLSLRNFFSGGNTRGGGNTFVSKSGLVLGRPEKKRPVRKVKNNAEKAAAHEVGFGVLTERALRHGDHVTKLRRRREIREEDDMFHGTAHAIQTCIGCDAALPGDPMHHDAADTSSYICQACRPNAPEIIQDYLRSFKELDTLCEELWEKCRVCQADSRAALEDDEGEDEEQEGEDDAGVSVIGEDGLVECRATTCSNFFRRTTVKRDRNRRQTVASQLSDMSW